MRRRRRFDGGGQFTAIHPGHLVIRHDGCDQMLAQQLERLRAALGEQDVVTVTFENSLIELPGPEVIVHAEQL